MLSAWPSLPSETIWSKRSKRRYAAAGSAPAAKRDPDLRIPYNAGILGIGMAVPDKVLTNADLESLVDTTDDWIVSRTGIKERRVCSPEQSSSTLGTEAARRAMEHA